MSAISDRTLAVATPVGMCSDCVRMPLCGVLSVALNVALVSLGIRIHWPFTCAFMAGLVNGTALSVIAVSVASVRCQASAAGLLGGMSFSSLRSDGSMISKAMQSLHGVADSVLTALGVELNEQLQLALEQEALCMVWTTLFLVLASLVAERVQSARSQG